MPSINTVAIISKPGAAAGATLVPELLAWLRKRGIGVRCDEATASYAQGVEGHPRERTPEGAQLAIVLGGDGTVLSAARVARDVPLFAVNLGDLGFLTAIKVAEIFSELERALRGEQCISSRRMLYCELWRDNERVCGYEALNDAVITKATLARIVTLDTFVDEHFMCTFRADGLIVSTPTGSTAYTLAAGGPIIFPTVSAFCITPICPHMLTNRPVVVPDECVISVVCKDLDGTSYLTVDGQVGEPLKRGDRVVCRRSPHEIRLVRPPAKGFFDVLREKLKWGER